MRLYRFYLPRLSTLSTYILHNNTCQQFWDPTRIKLWVIFTFYFCKNLMIAVLAETCCWLYDKEIKPMCLDCVYRISVTVSTVRSNVTEAKILRTYAGPYLERELGSVGKLAAHTVQNSVRYFAEHSATISVTACTVTAQGERALPSAVTTLRNGRVLIYRGI
jgi:hypothetical protein